MSTYITRMEAEHAQLVGRLQNLEHFLGKPEYDALGLADRILLVEQCGHMRAYERVLSARLSRAQSGRLAPARVPGEPVGGR